MKNPTKPESERAIRQLCHVWRRLPENAEVSEQDLNPYGFIRWLRDNHSAYLRFRSVMSPEYEAERWFAEEFRQTWKN
jgi:hypothetical protein